MFNFCSFYTIQLKELTFVLKHLLNPRELVEVETMFLTRKNSMVKYLQKNVNFFVAKIPPVPVTIYQGMELNGVRHIHLSDQAVMVTPCMTVSGKVL